MHVPLWEGYRDLVLVEGEFDFFDEVGVRRPEVLRFDPETHVKVH